VDDADAGRKAPCPRCGQRLLVPPPSRPALNRTVLGQPIAPPESVSHGRRAAAPITVRPEEYPPQEYPVARGPSPWRMGCLAFVLVGLLTGIGVLGMAALQHREQATAEGRPQTGHRTDEGARAADPHRTARRPGDTNPVQPDADTPLPFDSWSHQDLLAHFKKKGLDLDSVGTTKGTTRGPAMYFARPGTTVNHFILDALFVNDEQFRDAAYVQKRKTAEEARDDAAVLGENAFAWHRFYFSGPPKFLAELRRLLP
jgi:hypothetical protein